MQLTRNISISHWYNTLSHSTSIAVISFDSSVLSPCFGADQCTPDPFWELTYVLYIDSQYIYRSKQTAKNITNEILAVTGQGIAVFWNFVLTIAFFNRHFIVVALSHPVEYFWYFGIRWLTHNCLWSRDLTDDTPILEAWHHCKATPD